MACITLPTAMLISGGLAAAGGVASAVIGSNASHDAAAQQQKAAQEAAAYTKQQVATATGNLSPYMSLGTDALPELKNLLGLGEGGSADIMKQLQSMPGYQFQLQQGLQATQSGFAAQGLGQSGAALKGAANYSEGLAGTSYQSLFGNVLNSVGLGQQAAGTLAGVSLSGTNAVNSLTTGGAAAGAAGTVGAANSVLGGINSATSGITNALTLPAILKATQGLYTK